MMKKDKETLVDEVFKTYLFSFTNNIFIIYDLSFNKIKKE